MGSYGAVAEFFQEPGEAIDTGSSSETTCITPRGGIRIRPRKDIGICAYERTIGNGDKSQQHIALCLPLDASRMSGAEVLTERGSDSEALNENDCDAVLFDLGVSSMGSGCFQSDFCVRIADPNKIDFFREHCGSSIFEHGSPVVPKLIEAQPPRIVITRLGRIEVYQAIGGEHTDDKTPEGPHTHLSPELLPLNLTHSADVPIKESWVPCAFLYSKNTVFAEGGEAHRDN